ncbi:hypothetical protein MCAV_04240 [[Mycoplasma] cavipharyngis]|uniref:hypothetical protein n=1 Tax=[Mycoplasma] cavipharyngis TaxID=92757 RepID=UPI003703AE4B
MNQTVIISMRLIFLILVFFLPIILVFVEIVFFFVLKERKYLPNKISNELHKYNYLVHNFGFIFTTFFLTFLLVILITFNLITSKTEWWNQNSKLWTFNNSTSYFFFSSIVNIGISFYTLAAVLYLVYNLKKTNSYFARKLSEYQKKSISLNKK